MRFQGSIIKASLSKASESVEAIRKAVQDGAKHFPEFRIGLTGRPVLDADEMKTSDRDSHRSEHRPECDPLLEVERDLAEVGDAEAGD